MAELTVPQLDFTPLSRLGEVFKNAQRDAVRQRTLSELGRNGGPFDYGNAARALLAAGDTEGGLGLARLAEAHAGRGTAQANADRAFNFQVSQAARAQSNADRQFAWMKENANKPSYQIVDDGTGNKRIVQIAPFSGQVADVTPDGLKRDPTNPYAAGGKMTEAQVKDALYATRMMNAENVLGSNPAVVQAGQSRAQRTLAGIPVVGNALVSGDYQQFDQARRDFINATLRRESGAAIAESEFDNANEQYFPQGGDGPDVLRQKAVNRAAAIRGFAAGAGPNWKPPYVFDDASGKLVKNDGKAPGQGAASAPSPASAPIQRVTTTAEANAAYTAAQDAIAKGAPRDAVLKRLRDMGVPSKGL